MRNENRGGSPTVRVCIRKIRLLNLYKVQLPRRPGPENSVLVLSSIGQCSAKPCLSVSRVLHPYVTRPVPFSYARQSFSESALLSTKITRINVREARVDSNRTLPAASRSHKSSDLGTTSTPVVQKTIPPIRAKEQSI
jgi:hypothetical protein